jgi:hypothetical protein
VKYAFITQHKNTYPISLQCQVLGVRRQCYYHYRRHTENNPVDPGHQESYLPCDTGGIKKMDHADTKLETRNEPVYD